MRYILAVLVAVSAALIYALVARGYGRKEVTGRDICECEAALGRRIESLTSEIRLLRIGGLKEPQEDGAEGNTQRQAFEQPISTLSGASSFESLQLEMKSVVAKLGELEQRLLEGTYVDPPAPQELVQNAPPRNWSNLDEFARLHWKSKESAAEAVLFLGYSDILARFGIPTRVSDKNRWLYRRDRDTYDQGQAIEVEFQFRGGYVIETAASLSE